MVGRYGLLSVKQGVIVMDFTDPSAPQPYSQLTLPDRWESVVGQFEIVVRHPYAYVPSWSVGFYIVDISDLASPQVVGQTALPSAGRAVALHDQWAYVGGVWRYTAPGYVVDISEPAAPQVVDTIGFFDGGLFDVHVEGSILYAASGHIYVVDLAQPTKPVVIDTFPVAASCLSFVKQGQRVYAVDVQIAGLHGIGCFDVSDPVEPVFLGKLSNGGGNLSVDVLNDHAWVGVSSGGVYAVNVADPYNPAPVYCYSSGLSAPCSAGTAPIEPSGITIYDRFAFVSDQSHGLVAYELNARGDATADGVVTSSDIIVVVSFVFKGGPPPANAAQANTSCTGSITATDVILLVNYVFKGANVPACP